MMIRLLIILEILPLCVYGRFGRYGVAPAPERKAMPKSLRDEVAQEDQGRFSDTDAYVTGLKDEDLEACFITKYDPEWNLDFDEKQHIKDTQEPERIRTLEELATLEERAGNIIASMCKKMKIYWLLDSSGSPLPMGSRNSQGGAVLDLPTAERIPVPQQGHDAMDMPVPQRIPSGQHGHGSMDMPVPQRIPSGQHSHSSMAMPVPQRIPSEQPGHGSMGIPVPVPQRIPSGQHSHGSMSIPVPQRLPGGQQDHSSMKIPVPVRRPQNHENTLPEHEQQNVLPVPIRPNHKEPSSEQAPQMQVFRKPYLVPHLQVGEGRPYRQPMPRMSKSEVRSEELDVQPFLVPEKPNEEVPKLQRRVTK